MEYWNHFVINKLEGVTVLNAVYKRDTRGVNSKHYLVMTSTGDALLIPNHQLGGMSPKNGSIITVEANHLGKSNFEFFAYTHNTKPTKGKNK